MKFERQTALFICLGALAVAARAEEAPDPASVPAALKAVLPKGASVLAMKQGDLNGDALPDYVFVADAAPPGATRDELEDGPRLLGIALGQPGGGFKLVKTNDKVVFCKRCGGVWGDPFAALEVGKNRFAVEHVGGSSSRWTNRFEFAYSRKDSTWQLVRVEESTYETSKPDKVKSRSYKPPRDFGKIDIADFDPDQFKGVGPK